jgi:hypothetical protein
MVRFYISDGNYNKKVIVNDNEYLIQIPNDIWNKYGSTKISDHITYWLYSMRKGKKPKLKYGSYSQITKSDAIANKYVCNICKKSYTTPYNYRRHKKTHTSEELIKQNSSPENIRIPHSQNIEHLETHTINNDNRIQNNIQINITAPNDFRKENPKWLTPELILRAVRDMNTAIPTLIRAKHFNDKFPENNNIRLIDRRDIKKRLHVYEGKRWTIQDRTDVADQLIFGVYDILNEVFQYFRGDEPFEYDEDDLDESELHNRKVLNDIQRSERASKILNRTIQKWKMLMKEYGDNNKELFEKLNDRLDTILLDNELKISQLKDKIR